MGLKYGLYQQPGKCYGKGSSAYSMEQLLAQGRCATCSRRCNNCLIYSNVLDRPTLKKQRSFSAEIECTLSSPRMRIQSSENDYLESNLSKTTGNDIQQNIEFSDENAGVELNIPAAIGYVKGDTSQNIELGDFLNRPVQIDSFSWTEGTSINRNIAPWDLFFNNARIRAKLDNYFLMRCNLKVKVVINASPFYYSGMCISYKPLTDFAVAPLTTGAELIPRSQRPCVWIYPQNSQGATMTLPFFYYKNWLDVTDRTAFQTMGQLNFLSATDLFNANSVVGGSVDVIVYAWAENVELAGPTSLLALQSAEKTIVDDEYSGKGAISNVASAIARHTVLLQNLPIVGPYMTATSLATGAVSKIASTFGYTRTPVIEDVRFYRSIAVPHIASTDIGEPVEKLGLDSKNSLSIDPKINGIDMDDELIISTIVQRESYFDSFLWTDAQSTGTNLVDIGVTPEANLFLSGTGEDRGVMTPMSHLCKLFDNWRGDIIVRFKILCTKYHKGRIQVTWDPRTSPWPLPLDTTTSTNYSKVIDISKNTDVEFRIPYTQQTSYLHTNDYEGLSNPVSTTGALTNHNFIMVF